MEYYSMKQGSAEGCSPISRRAERTYQTYPKYSSYT